MLLYSGRCEEREYGYLRNIESLRIHLYMYQHGHPALTVLCAGVELNGPCSWPLYG